ncbi:hypothetical protein BS78_10G111800 [Paspalum vaginatum]|nr:hypothetical protein BS78_10G111800 [Paspalum vaginatum]
MERGKKQVEDLMTKEELELRKRKARREYEIIARQFLPLLAKVDELLEQHQAPQGQDLRGTMIASGVDDSSSARQVGSERLADSMRRCLRQLDKVKDEESDASTSGRSRLLVAADQKPQLPVTFTPPKPAGGALCRPEAWGSSWRSQT